MIGSNNKLIFSYIDDDRLLEKYKTISTILEDLQKIELNALPFYNNKYIKLKIKTYGDKNYTNFYRVNVPEDDVECESFTIISIDSLLVYEKSITCKYI